MPPLDVEARRYRQLIELAKADGNANGHAAPLVGVIMANLLRWAGEVNDIEPPQAPEAVAIAETGLDVRIVAALERHGMLFLGDVAARTAEELAALPSFGPKAIGSVRAALREYGLELAAAERS